MRIRFSILQKFVFAFLMLSIIPLCVLGFYTSHNLWRLGESAIASSSTQLEKRARDSIELRAIEVADQVTQLLQSCETDLLTLQQLPRNPQLYLRFSLNHRHTIWTRQGTNAHYTEVHESIPQYRELAFIDAAGVERIRIVNDRIVPPDQLRDVSQPGNTTYQCEHYFAATRKLRPGQIYVSHVTGWYVTRHQQLGNAKNVEAAVEGKKYQGVVRFATPCYDARGHFQGIVMLSLDHRHLMELTMHILPTEKRFVIFPSYASGNYAFMFDDQGWMISHPKFWDIRGILPGGRRFDPTAPYYTRAQMTAGKVPFNLNYAGFINPNYPLIARRVMAGKSGVTSTFNVGGTARVMAYAPIFYPHNGYTPNSIFGGITIGVQTAKFKEPELLTEDKIDEMVSQTKRNSLIILGSTALGAILLAFFLARTFTKPIQLLSRKTQDIAAGHLPGDLAVRTGDELELLAGDFVRMAAEIRHQRESLEESLTELAASKQSVEQYTKELEKRVRILKNVHYLSHYLSDVFDRELVLQTLLKTCVEGLGFERALLYLYDPATQCLVCHHTYGFAQEHERRAKDYPYRIGHHDCVPTRAFRTGETIFVQDIRTDPRATALDHKIAARGRFEFFVFTPLKSRDKVIGVLGADTAKSRRPIGEMEVESLQIVANDAARAIERSQLYRHLLGERDFIKAIFANMTSGVITLDETHLVSSLNPYSEKVFRIDRNAALDHHYRDVFRDFPDWLQVIDGFLREGAPEKLSLEHQLIFPDGKTRFLEVQLSRKPATGRRQTIYLLFLRDITARKRLEDHIRRSDRLISLGVLAAGIAHEIRNPLTGISLLLDDLHDHLEHRTREKDMIQGALQEIDRLENVVNALLDFATPSNGTKKLITGSIQTVFQNTLLLIKKQCKNQNVRLSVHQQHALPQLELDPERLQQALLNILLNAIQAMPDGGQVQIGVKRITAEESLLSQPAVRISVTDTGRGIDTEDMPYIFDPFFSRNPTGSGLGLSIVHNIIEEHKARISVSSELGRGTSFCIDFPVTEPH